MYPYMRLYRTQEVCIVYMSKRRECKVTMLSVESRVPDILPLTLILPLTRLPSSPNQLFFLSIYSLSTLYYTLCPRSTSYRSYRGYHSQQG